MRHFEVGEETGQPLVYDGEVVAAGPLDRVRMRANRRSDQLPAIPWNGCPSSRGMSARDRVETMHTFRGMRKWPDQIGIPCRMTPECTRLSAQYPQHLGPLSGLARLDCR